jgi:hypothetical protein
VKRSITSAGRVRCALANALGDHEDFLRRTPVTPDVIVRSIEAGKRMDAGLVSHV